jgi:hypothetical protein
MRYLLSIAFIATEFVLLLPSGTVHAQAGVQVWMPGSSTPICVNATNHRIDVRMARVRGLVSNGFFNNQKSIAVHSDLILKAGAISVEFNQMDEQPISKTPDGVVDVPISQLPAARFPLNQTNKGVSQPVNSFSLKAQIVRTFGVSDATKAFLALTGATTTAQIPQFPYSGEIKAVTEVLNSLVTSISKLSPTSDRQSYGVLNYAISDNQTCQDNDLYTGVYAFIQWSPETTEAGGFAQPDRRYCFALAPKEEGFNILFAPLEVTTSPAPSSPGSSPTTGTPPSPASTASNTKQKGSAGGQTGDIVPCLATRILKNPYMAFTVTASLAPGAKAPEQPVIANPPEDLSLNNIGRNSQNAVKQNNIGLAKGLGNSDALERLFSGFGAQSWNNIDWKNKKTVEISLDDSNAAALLTRDKVEICQAIGLSSEECLR